MEESQDLIAEIREQLDRAEAAEEVMNVGLKHSEAGGYRIFFQSQAWDVALNERTNP